MLIYRNIFCAGELHKINTKNKISPFYKTFKNKHTKNTHKKTKTTTTQTNPHPKPKTPPTPTKFSNNRDCWQHFLGKNNNQHPQNTNTHKKTHKTPKPKPHQNPQNHKKNLAAISTALSINKRSNKYPTFLYRTGIAALTHSSDACR